MAFEHKPETGTLFKNDKKETDKHPDYKGQALIDGVEYWVSGWVKRPEGKTAFLSLSFQPKSKPKSGQSTAKRKPEPEQDDGELF